MVRERLQSRVYDGERLYAFFHIDQLLRETPSRMYCVDMGVSDDFALYRESPLQVLKRSAAFTHVGQRIAYVGNGFRGVRVIHPECLKLNFERSLMEFERATVVFRVVEYDADGIECSRGVSVFFAEDVQENVEGCLCVR